MCCRRSPPLWLWVWAVTQYLSPQILLTHHSRGILVCHSSLSVWHDVSVERLSVLFRFWTGAFHDSGKVMRTSPVVFCSWNGMVFCSGNGMVFCSENGKVFCSENEWVFCSENEWVLCSENKLAFYSENERMFWIVMLESCFKSVLLAFCSENVLLAFCSKNVLLAFCSENVQANGNCSFYDGDGVEIS